MVCINTVVYSQQILHLYITSVVYVKEDQAAALASFDSYYNLLILMDPNPLEEKLVQFKFFPDEEQHLCSDQQATFCPKIETILKKARSIIVHKGAAKFIELVEIISQKKPYDELAYHMIGKCDFFLCLYVLMLTCII